jgi:hypothetical protein
MSIQTTELRAEARAAGQKWKTHKQNCVYCTDKPKGRCGKGDTLEGIARAALDAARKSARADKGPGQSDVMLPGMAEYLAEHDKEAAPADGGAAPQSRTGFAAFLHDLRAEASST